MTDRVRTLTVVLDQDMRDDDVQVIVRAIKMLRHVDDVKLGTVLTAEYHIARETARLDLVREVYTALGVGVGK